MLTLPSATSHILDSRYQQMAVAASLLWILGIWLAGFSCFNFQFWLLWLCIAIGIIIAFLFTRQSAQLLQYGLGFFVLCSSGFLGHVNLQYFHKLPKIHAYLEQPQLVQAILESPVKLDVETGKPLQWRIKITSIDHKKLISSFEALLMLNRSQLQQQVIHVGDIATVKMTLTKPASRGIPDGFDYQQYLHLDGIQAIGKIKKEDSLAIIGQSQFAGYVLQRYAAQVRDAIIMQFGKALPPKEAHLLGSIVLGEHASPIEGEMKNNFRNAGLAHILAASGMNVGLVAAFILGITSLLKIPFRLKIIICMITSAFYAVMTGLPPSILRAGLMLEIALFLTLLRRELSPLLVLNIAATILSSFNPSILQTVSFQLSFLSTFGLLAMTPPIEKWLAFYIGRTFAALLLVPLIAQIWVLPIQILVFHQISLTALPANIIAVPLVALLTYGGFGLGLLSLILPVIAQFLMGCLYWVLIALEWTSNGLGTAPLANIAIGHVSVWITLGLYFVLFYLSLKLLVIDLQQLLQRKRTLLYLKVALTIGLIILLPFSFAKWQSQSQTSFKLFANALWGEANALIQLQNGQTVVVLTNYGSNSLYNLKNALQNKGLRNIDVLILAVPPPQKKRSQLLLSELFHTWHVQSVYYNAIDTDWGSTLASVQTIEKIRPIDFSSNSTYRLGNLGNNIESITLKDIENGAMALCVNRNNKAILQWLTGEHVSISNKNTPYIVLTSFSGEPVQAYYQRSSRPQHAVIRNYFSVGVQENNKFNLETL